MVWHQVRLQQGDLITVAVGGVHQCLFPGPDLVKGTDHEACQHRQRRAMMVVQQPGQEARKAQQSAFLQGLIDAKITAVWFTLNPQMYFSPIAKWKTAEDLKQYRAMVTNLGTSIIEAYKKAEAPLPGVYVGFEITNNLVEPNWPRKAPHKATENAVEV